MNEIKLSVDDENLETVLTVLNNLKDGLIKTVDVNGEEGTKKRATQYKPKTNTIIREENSGTNDISGKYLNPNAYRQRLKRAK